MKVVLEEIPKKGEKRRKAIYISTIAICLIAFITTIYVLVSHQSEETPTTSDKEQISEEEYAKKEEDFEEIFSNKTINQTTENILNANKIKAEDEIIGTSYESQAKIIGKYSLNVKVPYININNATVRDYNTQIEQIFKQKALDIMNNSASKNVVYTVDYIAYINENNVLSIAIRSILKEGNNAQRTIIQTYNYDFENSREVPLDEILAEKKLKEKDVEAKIVKKIKQEQAKVDELKKLGYNIFERDYKSDIYKIENTTEFFIGPDGFLYLIYAYGNDNYTSELDLVIF